MFQQAAADLVITDIVMPEKEGFEVLRELRRMQPPVKIIAISGAGRDRGAGYLQTAKVMGAAKVLAKPFSTDVLMAAITRMPDRADLAEMHVELNRLWEEREDGRLGAGALQELFAAFQRLLWEWPHMKHELQPDHMRVIPAMLEAPEPEGSGCYRSGSSSLLQTLHQRLPDMSRDRIEDLAGQLTDELRLVTLGPALKTIMTASASEA